MFKTVLSQNAQDALAILGRSGILKNAYLAGGSALALQFGHRISVDFDFFTQKRFNPANLGRKLTAIGDFKKEVAKGITLIGTFNDVKFSCFTYDYPLIGHTTEFLSVALAHPHDIAAMKLSAICDRATKRDYVDLFVLHQQGISIESGLRLYGEKYHVLEENMFTLLKALSYFDEAETTDMPKMLIPVSWDAVKRFFISESMRLAKKYLE